ncbi:hypothetical protein ERAN111884_01670 [Erysipelothrix anatis]
MERLNICILRVKSIVCAFLHIFCPYIKQNVSGTIRMSQGKLYNNWGDR